MLVVIIADAKKVEVESLPIGVVWKFRLGIPAQMSSASLGDGPSYEVRRQYPSCCFAVRRSSLQFRDDLCPLIRKEHKRDHNMML
ncbi:hypothetical protein TNCV_1630381 [Trichonephila clavipes]|uniref:Uncharacterized protein n=1 Tax=Trichonephila clavipes TaxID=2585209 RepID=A0A8X6VWN5_TRICX|nr:hypothetical protein TNCV_1630381 [Trichonephila clavipes]